jgi:hypothetical protein
MRLGWSVPLGGPFRLSGTVWRSKRRRSGYYGVILGGWRCRHNHSRLDLAETCARREADRRARGIPPSPAWQYNKRWK